MPRRSRIDAAGVLHHVMVRGIERGKVFQSDTDRNHFLERLGKILKETKTLCYALRAGGLDLDGVALRVSEVLGLEPGEVWAAGKYRRIVEARSLLCYWAVRELGETMSCLARKLGISIPSVSDSVARGHKIAEKKGFSLLET